MAKLKQEIIGSGTLPFRANATLMHSREAADIEAMRRVIAAGDAVDADGGVLDGDIDTKGSVSYLFFKENLKGRMWVEPEEGDEV